LSCTNSARIPAIANARAFQLSRKNPRASPKTFGSITATSGIAVRMTFISGCDRCAATVALASSLSGQA
jgi:hypothetical protein